MSEYWVDLGVASTGGDGLSPSTYWGWSEFEPHYEASMAVGDIFNCRGMHVQTSNFEAKLNTNNTIRAWDVDAYGPWRIYGANTYFARPANGSGNTNTVLENGIIEGKFVGRGHHNTYMYFKSNTGIMFINTVQVNTDDDYCTFSYVANIEGIVSLGLPTTATAVNCVFKPEVFGAKVLSSSFNDWDFTNSGVTSAPSLSVFVDLFWPGSAYFNTSITYGATLAATPAWDDSTLTDFDLYAGEGVGAPGGWAAPTGPTADFTGTPLSGDADLTVTFTDASTGATGWDWDFGDGNTSTDQNPVHIYTLAGVHTVTLEVTDGVLTDTKVRTDYVTVNMVANFTSNRTTAPTAVAVAFSDTTFGDPDTWQWNFDDGFYSSDQNPEHAFAIAGQYTITLEASNSEDSDTVVKTGYITVENAIPVVYTEDEAIPPSEEEIRRMASTGTALENFIIKGVRIGISGSEQNPEGSGFKRGNGPSLRFD